ncbi:MAG: universal stress protein, partial [Bacteroidota bacterium]|nr:universal stress protein [Bacteroidota bacterium]
PVLTVPPGVTFKPLQNVAFACNLRNINNNTPFSKLLKLVAFTEARLHVVYVTSLYFEPGSAEAANDLLVKNNLEEISPVYHTLLENQVVQAIGKFVEEHHIQLLLVIPKKHGLWQSLFHKSFTKELARLNRLPIMALH